MSLFRNRSASRLNLPPVHANSQPTSRSPRLSSMVSTTRGAPSRLSFPFQIRRPSANTVEGGVPLLKLVEQIEKATSASVAADEVRSCGRFCESARISSSGRVHPHSRFPGVIRPGSVCQRT